MPKSTLSLAGQYRHPYGLRTYDSHDRLTTRMLMLNSLQRQSRLSIGL
jgi:hypothetical protein